MANRTGPTSAIINIGCFIIGSADLDFHPKAFPEQLGRHVLGILREAVPWQAAVVDDQKRDAYACLTLKLVAIYPLLKGF